MQNTQTAQTSDAAPAESLPRTSTEGNIQATGFLRLASLDGNPRAYTVFILTTLAFSIATIYFDIGFLEAKEHDEVLLEKAAAGHALTAAGRQIVRAFMLLCFCIIIAGFSFFMVGISICRFNPRQIVRHQVWLALSFVSTVCFNGLVVVILVTSQWKHLNRQDDNNSYESGFSHYLLFGVLIASLLGMDFSFVVVFTQSNQDILQKEKEAKKKKMGWGRIQKQLSRIVRQRSQAAPQDRSAPETDFKQRVIDSISGTFNWLLKKTLNAMTAVVNCIGRTLGIQEEEEHTSGMRRMKYLTEDISDFFLDLTNSIQTSCLFQAFNAVVVFFSWDMWSFVREWLEEARKITENPTLLRRVANSIAQAADDNLNYWRNFGKRFRSGVNALYDDIREADQFEHSAWVLAAMCTSLVLLFYFGVALATYMTGYINESYIPHRNCAVWSMEKNGELGNFVFRMAGFTEGAEESGESVSSVDEQALAEAACSIDESVGQSFSADSAADTVSESLGTSIPSRTSGNLEDRSTEGNIAGISAFSADARFFSCSTESFSERSCASLELINRLERSMNTTLNESRTPSEVFKDHAIGQTIYVFDRLIRHLNWAIWIGLLVGLIVGIYSLLSVLAQYKRFSLAIRSGFFEDLPISEKLAVSKDKEKNIRRMESLVTERRWAKLITLYPMGASVFFFGILVSTAVIQLVVFGGVVALLFSLIASFFDDHVFTILRPYLAFLLAFLITWLFNGPLAQLVICEGILVKRYRLFHELSFLLFLLVYTAVHLVLGVFFALMRLVWVLLTTIACLNRLDRNLFPILKRNDLGHKSFMSMVLMQHAFLSNTEKGKQYLLSQVYDNLIAQQKPDGAPSPSSPPTRLTHTTQMTETKAPSSSAATPHSTDLFSVLGQAMQKKKSDQQTEQEIEEPTQSTPMEETVAKEVVFYLRKDFEDGSGGAGTSKPAPPNLPIV